MIVNEINKEDPCTSKYGHFVEGIKSEMRSLETASFLHVKREGNTVAHRLAKMATTHAAKNTWLENVPPDIYGIVRGEEIIPFL